MLCSRKYYYRTFWPSGPEFIYGFRITELQILSILFVQELGDFFPTIHVWILPEFHFNIPLFIEQNCNTQQTFHHSIKGKVFAHVNCTLSNKPIPINEYLNVELIQLPHTRFFISFYYLFNFLLLIIHVVSLKLSMYNIASV